MPVVLEGSAMTQVAKVFERGDQPVVVMFLANLLGDAHRRPQSAHAAATGS